MRRNVRTLVLAGGAAAVVAACPAVARAQEAAWPTYTDLDTGFELRYPAGWEVIRARAGGGGQEAYLLGPDELAKVTIRETGESLAWPGEFRVRVLPGLQGRSLRDWFAENRTEGVWEGRTGEVVVDGQPALRWAVWQADALLHETAVAHDDRLVLLSYTTTNRGNDPDAARHAQIYERILLSFRFVPRASGIHR